MATLAEAVDAAETDWLVSTDIPDTVDYFTVESEVVQVTATFPAQYQARDGSTSDPRIRVVRAAGGTTAASHADGTALTPLIPPSAGGGAAEAGTVVVTPGEETDVAAALEGADAPGAGNPFATEGVLAVRLGTRILVRAEILTLFSVPVTVVTGVPGTILVPLYAVLRYTFADAEYSGTGQVSVGWPLIGVIDGGSIVANTSASETTMGPPFATVPTLDPDLVGQPIDVWMATGDPSASPGANGTLSVYVWYRELDVS